MVFHSSVHQCIARWTERRKRRNKMPCRCVSYSKRETFRNLNVNNVAACAYGCFILCLWDAFWKMKQSKSQIKNQMWNNVEDERKRWSSFRQFFFSSENVQLYTVSIFIPSNQTASTSSVVWFCGRVSGATLKSLMFLYVKLCGLWFTYLFSEWKFFCCCCSFCVCRSSFEYCWMCADARAIFGCFALMLSSRCYHNGLESALWVERYIDSLNHHNNHWSSNKEHFNDILFCFQSS